MRLPRRKLPWLMLAVTSSVILALALIPVKVESREALFEIPRGTWARRSAGISQEVLPSEIRLVLGLSDVLVLKNLDDVPQIFGPTLLMPGQTLRLPFSTPSETSFACTAHSNGQLLIVVEAAPVWPWDRLGWRVRRIVRGLSKT